MSKISGRALGPQGFGAGRSSDLCRAPPAPKPERKKDVARAPAPAGQPTIPPGSVRAPMSKIRKRIAETLLRHSRTAAILTTFNEVELTEVIELRNKFKERFQEVHGVGWAS
jgi:2-oxoglutarate dehydrogenase E2 component (dihydrolipoamide succinyltransferase)